MMENTTEAKIDSSELKKLLLRSGIPLEVSVTKKLKDMGITDLGEIEYERDGKIFSTDIHVFKLKKIYKNIFASLEFVIECKYKERNHIWLFLEFPQRYDFPSNLSFGDDIVNKFFRDSLDISYFKFPKNLKDLPVANKGIELIIEKNDKGSINPSIIPESISQAIFGSIKVYRDSVEEILEYLIDFIENNGAEDTSYVLYTNVIPLIITTSRLYKLKSNVSLEDIEKSDNIMDLLEEVDAIILNINTESITNEFRKTIFEKYPINSSTINSAVALFGGPIGGVSVDTYGNIHYPEVYEENYVIIVNYKKLNDVFLNFLNER